MFKEIQARFHMNRGIKATEKARKAEGEAADRFFEQAYKSFALSMAGNVALPEALHHWGLALFYQAEMKSGKEAKTLLKNACEKYSAAQAIEPNNPNTATDWGVALMAEARRQNAEPSDDLYEQAKAKFLAAEEHWSGIASYNLACLHAIRGEEQECKNYLTSAQELDSLPPLDVVKEDADLSSMNQKAWFQTLVGGAEAAPTSG